MKGSIKMLFGIVLLGVLGLQSCGINSNLMFKEIKGDEGKVTYNLDSIPKLPVEDYRISPDDKITFVLATNDGTKIVEKMSGVTQEMGGVDAGVINYLVDRNGKVKLPVVGEVELGGKTIRQAEDTLAILYSKEYIDPFIQVQVTNQRVIVFPGNGSDATVVPLANTNTTLMEALAAAGGITDRGKAKSIKLMRRVNGERIVYGIDLSTMAGLQHVDMIVQAGDFIYVEPTAELAKEVAEDIVPVVSLLSSALFIVSAINLLK